MLQLINSIGSAATVKLIEARIFLIDMKLLVRHSGSFVMKIDSIPVQRCQVK
jgi:hypothetical protein